MCLFSNGAHWIKKHAEKISHALDTCGAKVNATTSFLLKTQVMFLTHLKLVMLDVCWNTQTFCNCNMIIALLVHTQNLMSNFANFNDCTTFIYWIMIFFVAVPTSWNMAFANTWSLLRLTNRQSLCQINMMWLFCVPEKKLGRPKKVSSALTLDHPADDYSESEYNKAYGVEIWEFFVWGLG